MKYIVLFDIIYTVIYMEILQLQYFCSAAELENFTLAAKRHFIPQSAISITIKHLETELGEALFDRYGNKVKLNENGKKFYLHAKRCIEEFESAKNSFTQTNEPTGEVRLLVLERRRTIAETIIEFNKKYPKINFTICHNLFDQPLIPYDMRVTSNPSNGKGFVSEPIASENLMLAVSSTHRLANKKTVAMAELSNESFVMLPYENSLHRTTEMLCQKNGFLPRKSILCDDPFYVRKYISSGLGISLIPPHSWDGLLDNNICLIPLRDEKVNRTTYLECRKDRLNQAHIKIFFDFCIEKSKQK